MSIKWQNVKYSLLSFLLNGDVRWNALKSSGCYHFGRFTDLIYEEPFLEFYVLKVQNVKILFKTSKNVYHITTSFLLTLRQMFWPPSLGLIFSNFLIKNISISKMKISRLFLCSLLEQNNSKYDYLKFYI